MTASRFDVVVVGAGPAGIAAACTAYGGSRRVAIVDDNPAPGGQIWRATENAWLRRLRSSDVMRFASTRIVGRPAPGVLLAETGESFFEFEYEKLIVATGARERFLPFPGWTLPGVLGAGGLQALVKSGLPIRGKRVVVAGSGPLLLAVAAFLKGRGAKVQLIAEQASAGAVYGFVGRLLARPGKFAQAVLLRANLRGIPYRTNCWISAAHGNDRVKGVTLNSAPGGKRELACDYVACGFGLVPNTELAQLLGCELRGGFVSVDDDQRTSVEHVYCAGEPTGIGGVEAALLEGQIAGWAAIGAHRQAEALSRRRDAGFSTDLQRAFALRQELKGVATLETVVCRCEDVTLGALRPHGSWRGAKLQTRCGMGPCQGRVCGPAVGHLLGWESDSIRPPLLPARADSLAGSV